MVWLKPEHLCNCETCKGSSGNDPAYDEMNKRISEGEFICGGYICQCSCHISKRKNNIKRLNEPLERSED